VAIWWLSTAAWLVLAIPSLRYGLVSGARIRYTILAAVVLSACYVAVEAMYSQRGAVFLLSVLLLVWVADITAYFIGRAFGKHKLAPKISPGKTVEGALGALFGVAVYSVVCIWIGSIHGSDLFPAQVASRFGVWISMAAMLGLCLASISGDLVESLIKRRAGAKDSSNLLPGHGGVLDRIDALLPVLPVAALLSLS
jgi:phosphatidate cytidylyltransferase